MPADLRKLGPAELVRLVNSTRLGPVMTERVLQMHRNEAGLRIGEGKKVDLVRYAAWLAVKRHTPKPPAPEGSDYERAKERARKRSEEASATGRDIAPLPEVVDPERKASCERDFRLYCETYHATTFYLPWSEDHLTVIGQVQQSVLEGGLFATAMPRGSGKTSIAECACEWAIAYGHRCFIPLIGSDEANALQMLDSVKTEFESNDLLLEDFPEIAYPIRCLDGISIRCKGQLYRGERTHIEWTNDRIVMPTIPGSKASGAVIRVGGITGGLRGMKFKRPDGRTVRPDLVLVDDPQTDASARSRSQCETRERILAGAILGLAGPGRKIAGLMPCTVIARGDMADNILDRDRHPVWNGTRTKMLYSFPAAEKLWEEYGRIRADSLRAEHGGREATEFYSEHREAMDAGATVAWEARHDPDELSAVQHAMNLFLRDRRAFFSEYQNEPEQEEVSRGDDLTADQVAARLNRHARGLVPIGCNRVTAMIDVQATLLFYTVVAWEDDFSGYVIDYGAFPDQKRAYYTLRDAKIVLADAVKATGLEGHLYGGLERLCGEIVPRDWVRDDGAALKIERCLIDANWGASTDIIYKFCRESAHSAVITPSHGKYVGAASKPMREYDRKPGDRVGLNWRIPGVQNRRAVRWVIYDTNFWKGFVHARLGVAMGDRGSLSLFGDSADRHSMFADHVCSEYRVRTQGRGREVDEYKLRPDRPDNHWLDCLTGCAVAASMQGVALPETAESKARNKGARMSFSEYQRRRREGPGVPAVTA